MGSTYTAGMLSCLHGTNSCVSPVRVQEFLKSVATSFLKFLNKSYKIKEIGLEGVNACQLER